MESLVTFMKKNNDVARLIVSYVDTDSDLYYNRVIKLIAPEKDYDQKNFVLLCLELSTILGIPRYLEKFKRENENFAAIYEKHKKQNVKSYISMNNANSFVTEWVISVYH